MGFFRCGNRRGLPLLAAFCLLSGGLSGCAAVGPRSIGTGQASYNEAINKAKDEQMLLWIVRGRYGETFSLLSVSSVAANIRFSSNAGFNAGFGPDRNYAGNLVPFSGGMAYEENPTVTYEPVHGERYLRQLLSPIPLDILVLMVRTSTSPAKHLAMLANRINDMRSPDILDGSDGEPVPRFRRFVELTEELDRAGVLEWVEDPKKEASFAILITGYAPAHSREVREYLDLLGQSAPADESLDIVLPVHLAVKGRDPEGVAISTRSTFDLIQVLRAAIEVPPEHAAAGLTSASPTPGLKGRGLRIRASKEKPEGATVAVKHRDYWFYIHETDMRTKTFYLILRTLWSVAIAAADDQQTAPVLTIPVSR